MRRIVFIVFCLSCKDWNPQETFGILNSTVPKLDMMQASSKCTRILMISYNQPERRPVGEAGQLHGQADDVDRGEGLVFAEVTESGF